MRGCVGCVCAGVLDVCVGMLDVCVGMLDRCAGVLDVCAGVLVALLIYKFARAAAYSL